MPESTDERHDWTPEMRAAATQIARDLESAALVAFAYGFDEADRYARDPENWEAPR